MKSPEDILELHMHGSVSAEFHALITTAHNGANSRNIVPVTIDSIVGPIISVTTLNFRLNIFHIIFCDKFVQNFFVSCVKIEFFGQFKVSTHSVVRIRIVLHVGSKRVNFFSHRWIEQFQQFLFDSVEKRRGVHESVI